jgi:adenosine deaminase
MLTTTPLQKLDYYQSLPKVDLHRHLEGSLRLRTLREVSQEHGMDMPATGRLRELVQMGAEEAYTFENFLAKFKTLRLFYQSPEVISRVTQEAIADAALDNVRYLELRFTPVALSAAQGFPLSEVMDWVIEGARSASRAFHIRTRLIASLNRHEPLETAAEVARLAADRIKAGIIGLDLAGNEAQFPGLHFAGLFREARQAGLHITIHAGEWGGAVNVLDAIEILGAERIGHGVRVLEDPRAVALARERQTLFEVCLTSNYHSGVVPAGVQHPLPRLLDQGLNATLHTDDPSISQIALSGEYRLACEDLGLTRLALQKRILAAARGAFLPEAQRQSLLNELNQEFQRQEHPG